MRRSFLLILCLACVSRSLAADDAISPQTLKAVKAATVFIMVKADGKAASGSGFVVKADDSGIYVVTNYHVIEPNVQIDIEANRRRYAGWAGEIELQFAPGAMTERLTWGSITAVLDSGSKGERSAKGQVIAVDPLRDLAILRLKDVAAAPKPIDLEPLELVETMPVYTLGFPFGQALATGKAHPTITVGKAAISSLRENDDGSLAIVQIDGSLNPGNSGGPIVNAKGQLVGVAVATIRNSSGIGLAIPVAELQRLLEGDVGPIHLEAKPGVEKPVLMIEVGLMDPLNKIASLSARYLVTKDGPDSAKEAKSLEGLERTETVPLTRNSMLSVANLPFPGSGPQKELLLEVLYTTAQGIKKKSKLYKLSLRRFYSVGDARWQTDVVSKDGETKILGSAGEPLKDVAPDGGWLIGFEISTIGGVIRSLQPIYRTENGEVRGKQYGMKGDGIIVKAKDGYVVAGIIVKYGLLLDGMAVSFVRVRDGKVDPSDTYVSEWIGGFGGGARTRLGLEGRRVIGIIGNANETHCTGIGLVLEKGDDTGNKELRQFNSVRDPPPAGTDVVLKEGQAGRARADGARKDGESKVVADTKVFAGHFGERFQDVAPDGGWLVGFEASTSGDPKGGSLKSVQPIYRTVKGEVRGKQYGMTGKSTITVKANDGYVVAGLVGKFGLFVDGISVTFVRVKDGKVDPTDSYESEWIGGQGGGEKTKLGLDGRRAIGIIGTVNNNECWGIGLLLEKEPDAEKKAD